MKYAYDILKPRFTYRGNVRGQYVAIGICPECKTHVRFGVCKIISYGHAYSYFICSKCKKKFNEQEYNDKLCVLIKKNDFMEESKKNTMNIKSMIDEFESEYKEAFKMYCDVCAQETAVMYLDCEACKKTGVECVYVCRRCGNVVLDKELGINIETIKKRISHVRMERRLNMEANECEVDL